MLTVMRSDLLLVHRHQRIDLLFPYSLWVSFSPQPWSDALTFTSTMGLNHNMQLIMSGVLNVTQLIGVLSSLWTLDRFGRRNILILGSIAMFIAHFIIAVLVGKFSSNWPSHKGEGWTSVAFLLFYMLSFGASWGPIPWAMPAEIFPSSLRAKGVALSTCSSMFPEHFELNYADHKL